MESDWRQRFHRHLRIVSLSANPFILAASVWRAYVLLVWTPADAAPNTTSDPSVEADGVVSVRWHLATRNADDALREHLSASRTVDPDQWQVGRLCPRCASSAHGQPWVKPFGFVSLSRSGSHLVTAVSMAGPIGVDVESLESLAKQDVEIAHPTEAQTVRTREQRATMWVRKEAILKMLGCGLTQPMAHLRVGDYDVRDVPAPEGYRAAVAIAAPPNAR